MRKILSDNICPTVGNVVKKHLEIEGTLVKVY